MAYLVSAFIVALVAALFALQNIEPVYVKFLFWNAQTPLAIALFIAFGLGVAAALLAFLAGRVKGKFSRRSPEKPDPGSAA